jgi:hypothetical protein
VLRPAENVDDVDGTGPRDRGIQVRPGAFTEDFRGRGIHRHDAITKLL